MVESTGKRGILSRIHPDILLEAEAFAVRKHHGLREQQRSAGENGGIARARHLFFEGFDHFRVFEQAAAHGLENVVHHDGRGLAFGNGLAGGVELILGDVGCVVAGIGGNIGWRLIAPLVEIDALVLEGMGQLVGEDRFLFVDIDPVEKVDGFRFRIVISLDLLFEQRQQKRLEIKVAIEEAEFLENDFAALHALGAFIFIELFAQIAFDCGPRGELALDVAFDGQAGLVGGEFFRELVNVGEELLLWPGRE